MCPSHVTLQWRIQTGALGALGARSPLQKDSSRQSVHESDFDELYEPLVCCLQRICQNSDKEWDAKAITEANGLLKTISSSQFIAAFQTNNYFFGFTKSLSVQLQGSSKDVLEAYRDIEVVKATLRNERRKVDEAFKRPYQKMCELARLAGNDEGLYIPRRCERQTLRSNCPRGTADEYWKCAVFIPFLDHLIAELEGRFSAVASSAIQGLLLLPSHLSVRES